MQARNYYEYCDPLGLTGNWDLAINDNMEHPKSLMNFVEGLFPK